MGRLRLPLICALGVLVLLPQKAAAGGWWSYVDVNRSHVAPGQRVELDETVAFSSTAAAEVAQRTQRFHVYLLRGFDPSVVERAMRKPSPSNWWSPGGAEAIEVGRVAVNVSDANLGRATAAFTVPDIPPATYQLMLCDTACAEPLGDVIPVDLTVVADPATARMGSASTAWSDGVATRLVERLRARGSSLANEGRSAPPAAPWAYATWLVAGVLAGALALLVLLRRRSRRPRPADGVGWHPATRS